METKGIISIVVGVTAMLLWIWTFYFRKPKKAKKIDYPLNRTHLVDKLEKEIFHLLNAHRKSNPLIVDTTIQYHARLRAKEITDNFNHLGFHDAMKALKDLGALSSAEIIAFGYNSAGGTYQGWMNSPAHKLTMLKTNWNIVGVAVAKKDGRNYIVALFAQI